MMMPFCWCMLLLCLSANAEDTATCRESGKSVTFGCSSEACPSSIEGFHGMYLYKDLKEREEVFYYHSAPGSPEKITPRQRYADRIQTNGSLKNHTVTISNLSVDDSGFYSCVYKSFSQMREVRCDVYILVVRGPTPCPRSAEVPCACAEERSVPLAFIIIPACVICVLIITIAILVIGSRVKKWTGSRRRRGDPQVRNDYVYEVMTKNGLRPLAAPEH